MIRKILENIENQKITITQWIFGFIGIFFIRFFFESFSSPNSLGAIISDPYTLVHYFLYFLCVALGTIYITGYFIKNYVRASRVVLFGLPLLWLAPIIDIVLSRGVGYKMTYLFDTGSNLFFDFLTFFGTNFIRGVTYGMRIELAIIIIGFGWYLWIKNRKTLQSLIGALFLYIFIFIMGSLPGIIYTLSHSLGTGDSVEVIGYFEKLISQSTISHNTLSEGISSVSYPRFIELGFSKLMSQILFIISFIFGGLLFWKMDPNKFWSVIKNARPERINFYTSSLLCGVGFAYLNRLGNSFIWVDLLGIISLLISWGGLWMYAVHTNDIVDIEIDKISNTNRPLVKQEISIDDMHSTGNIWLVVGLLGSWSAGYYPFFMSLVYVASSYIYSVPPLRLRRIPVLSSFLISIACLATILAGFFFISIDKQIQNFPIFLSAGILIIVTLAINFKDIKDVEGDKANGIFTLLTLFPKNGVKIVGICFALSILLVPIFLSFYLLYIIAIPASIIGYKLVTKKPYNEKPIFILRFVFLVGIGVFYLTAYWLVYNSNLL